MVGDRSAVMDRTGGKLAASAPTTSSMGLCSVLLGTVSSGDFSDSDSDIERESRSLPSMAGLLVMLLVLLLLLLVAPAMAHRATGAILLISPTLESKICQQFINITTHCCFLFFFVFLFCFFVFLNYPDFTSSARSWRSYSSSWPRKLKLGEMEVLFDLTYLLIKSERN